MIAKLSTGNGFGGATRYLLRDGMSDEEKAKVKVLAAVGVDYTIADDGSITLDAKQVGRDFRFQAMMHPSVRKPVYDIALSWKVGEHIPSDEKLARTEELLKLVGLVNTQYVIVEHEKENEHSHAIVNIVDNDGNRISTHNLIERMLEAARMITENYGYAWGDTQKKETTNKIHKPQERARYIVKPIVEAAVAKAEKISDLPELLKPSGVECHIKRSAAGDVEGISFAYKMDGQLRRFRGSDLHRSLSARQIKKRLAAKKLAGEPETFVIRGNAALYSNRQSPWPKNMEKLHEAARLILKYRTWGGASVRYNEPEEFVATAVKSKMFGTVKFDLSKARFIGENRSDGMLENPDEVIHFADENGRALDLFTPDFWEYWKDLLEQTKIFVQQMAKYRQESQTVEKAQTPATAAKPIPSVTPVAQQQAAPTPPPAAKTYEIVLEFKCNYKYRIKKEQDGLMKLQKLDWDKKSPIVDGKHTGCLWYTKEKFTSYKEVGHDADGVYFMIKDTAGKTRYINQNGIDLNVKKKQQLGIVSKGYGGPSR